MNYVRYQHDYFGGEMLDAFAVRLYSPGKLLERVWDREYAGKWLDASVLTAANLGHAELREKLVALSRAVRDEQDSDGCVGTEGPLRRGRNQWGTWMPWYMITGWLDQYEQFVREIRYKMWVLPYLIVDVGHQAPGNAVLE